MIFNSFSFIFIFLPAAVVLYFLANRIKNGFGKYVLIVASLVFYSTGRLFMLVFLVLSMLVSYGFLMISLKTERLKKLCVAIPIVFDIGLLVFFKYTDFAIDNLNSIFGMSIPLPELVLPLGISFYTFQQIAYIVSASRGELEDLSVSGYMCYILYFPKLLMGPLTEPAVFLKQLNDDALKKVNWDNIASGIKLLSFGLFKKLFLADVFADEVSTLYYYLDNMTAADGILLVLFYTFEIYFDFSGYSDMAVGISMMFNIELPINFDSPYKAFSIRDFWKRWHVSLTSFLTKYVYFPLGGSKKGELRTYLNVMTVFLISGLWHGANWTFILWGVLHGCLSCFDRLVEKLKLKIFKPLRTMLTFMTVSVLWLLFGSESVSQWKHILGKIVRLKDLSVSDFTVGYFGIPEFAVIERVLHINGVSGLIHAFVFLAVSVAICFIPENNYKNRKKLTALSLAGCIAAFVLSVLCLSRESVFVYFGF